MRSDRLIPLLWAGVGLYIAHQGYRLELGTLGAPESGFFIFWVGLILAGLSLALFVQALRSARAVPPHAAWEWPRVQKGAKLIVALGLYAAVLTWMGFLASTFALLLFLFRGLGPQRWATALALATATTAVCYLLFGLFLGLQFPPGVLPGLVR